MIHVELSAGQTSIAVRHRTVEEIWYFLHGQGELWRRNNGIEEVVHVEPGVCITLPIGTAFQLRSIGDETLAAIAVTMPPWPGPGEAVLVAAYWPPRVPPGSGRGGRVGDA
jgi:mannose-6-phosphate isomerase-like protein (cupin superfamily)